MNGAECRSAFCQGATTVQQPGTMPDKNSCLESVKCAPPATNSAFHQQIEPSTAPAILRKEDTQILSPVASETIHNLSNVVSPSKTTTVSPELLGSLSLDDNWQTSKKNIRDRNAVMFMSEVMADVHFLVGSQETPDKRMRLPAHKYVLATSSSVFFAMFYGPLAEENEEIEIPDVEPNAFIVMLRYLYCDNVQVEAESVLSVLYCSKKYLLPHLAKLCVKFLESNLTVQNACLLLSQSRLFDETDLVERCFEVIDAQTELALASPGFTQIDYETLRRILRRDTLNAKEVTVFSSALEWSSAECKRRKLEVTAENQRTILGDALFSVRIPTMPLEEFANGPAQCTLFSIKEINDIFLHYTAENKPSLRFSAVPRSGLVQHKCHRFLSSAYRSNQWRYRGRCDSIQFTVDRRIFVVGFGLYGSSNGAATYKATIELKKMEGVLATKHTRFFSDGSSSTFAVYFDYPIQIEADVCHIASVVLDGNELSYFGQDGLSEVSIDCGVQFTFQSSSESTNGTGTQGGQIPEILFYAPSS